MSRFSVLFLGLVAVVSGSPFNVRGGRVSVGGSPAGLGTIPYQASLRTLENVHFCSSCIISNRWVITQAECTFGRAPTSVNVVVGTVLLDSGGVTHVSSNVVTHPDFNIELFLNEIGLVQTQVPITMTANVQTRALASAFFGPGNNAMSSGWSEGRRNELHFFFLTSLTNADCQSRLPAFSAVIYEHTLCMLAAAGNAICDRGNPLAIGAQLIGISAWDAACDGSLPSAHERMSHFRPWIESVIS